MAIYETSARERLAAWEAVDLDKGIYRLILDTTATHSNFWVDPWENATFSSSTYIPEPEVIEPMAVPGSLWEEELKKAGAL